MIELDADIYDTLEFVSGLFGGIGLGKKYEDQEETQPLCIYGMLDYATAESIYEGALYPNCLSDLYFSGLRASTSDWAIRRINERRHKPQSNRVSWKSYCKELNIVRKPWKDTTGMMERIEEQKRLGTWGKTIC